jgi:hypothetical protein
LSLKPTLGLAETPEINYALTRLLKKSGIIFFYTADKKEVRSWSVKQDADIVTCAGKIHSDLARGFIKADIINFDDFMRVYHLKEARAQGLVRLVDREYTIHAGDISEIRFKVLKVGDPGKSGGMGGRARSFFIRGPCPPPIRPPHPREGWDPPRESEVNSRALRGGSGQRMSPAPGKMARGLPALL